MDDVEVMDYMVPHFPLIITCPAANGEAFAPEAAKSIVGQTFDFVDIPVKVEKVWVEENDLVMVLIKLAA